MPNAQCTMPQKTIESAGACLGLSIGHWALSIGHWALGIVICRNRAREPAAVPRPALPIYTADSSPTSSSRRGASRGRLPFLRESGQLDADQRQRNHTSKHQVRKRPRENSIHTGNASRDRYQSVEHSPMSEQAFRPIISKANSRNLFRDPHHARLRDGVELERHRP
jgi:hypothetical protein